MNTTFSRLCCVTAAISFLALALSACDDGNSGNSSSQGQSQPSSPTTSVPGGASVGITTSVTWPPLADDVNVVENKLTKNILIVFDGSGSMGDPACGSQKETKLTVAKRAVDAFVKKIPEQDNIGLIVFDAKGLSVRVPLGVGNRDQIKREVLNIRADGGTPLGSSMQLSYEMLTKQGQRQLGYGEYSIVPVTDGEAGDMALLSRMINRITSESPVAIHSVGFCIGKGHSLNQQGKTIYREASNQDELTRGLEEVLAEAPNFTVGEFK